tara:strand:+ start:1814 stop:2200 length:387 start_codon:yes stop_codon:yes gene_type:complete
MTDQHKHNGPDHGHDRRRETPDNDHWLVRPATIRKLWWIFGAILAATVVAQFFIHVHGYFGVDEWTGFNALYGFLTCVGMVVFAKLLGIWLKRPDDYYRIEPRLSPDIDSGRDKRGKDKTDQRENRDA